MTDTFNSCDWNHWDTLGECPEWYINNGWKDVVTPKETFDALFSAINEMRNNETDQWKKQKLLLINDGIKLLQTMFNERNSQ